MKENYNYQEELRQAYFEAMSYADGPNWYDSTDIYDRVVTA